jgi:hypothetical protein
MVDDESSSSPVMPSFASLRDPRRRTAVDLLVPAAPAAEAVRPSPAPRPTGAPRPPEWADLWHLGVHVARTVAAVPGRVARWQVGCLRTLLGR